MISIDPQLNSERDNYKLMIGSIIPRPIAFVTTQSEEGVLNGAPFSYFSIVSANPPMISLGIQRNQGEMKDTARNIYHKQEFVVHIVDEENLQKVNETAATLPPEVSEIALAKLTPVSSKKIAVPGIVESKIRMECKLVKAIQLGEEKTNTDFIIGEIVQFHIDDSIYHNGKIDAKGLNAISRLAGSDYATIGEIITLERPK